ncbi:MAG TPA: hypothetical protein VEZ42_04860 [Pseudonocardia sp.]|nr:hypothetical protein [Pseudonocardia sp.]
MRVGRVLLVIAFVAALVGVLLPATAPPAAAHAGGLSSAASQARVLGLDPPVPGLQVRAVEFGARLRLDNGTGVPVVVEPLPGSVISGLPTVPPGGTAYWSDPRITIAADRDAPTRGVLAWSVPLRVGDQPVSVRGEQFWPPPPSPLWWLVVLAALAVPAVAGVLGAGRRWGRYVLAAATATVIVAHLVHVFGSAGVPEDQPYGLMVLSAAGYALLGWPLGLVGSWLTVRGNPAGPLLCVAAGGLFAVVITPIDVFTLVDAVVPYSWGADLDRLLVALTLGGGLGVVVAGVAALRRGLPAPLPPGPA